MDSDNEDKIHSISYQEEREIADLHGKINALTIVGNSHGRHGSNQFVSMVGSPHSKSHPNLYSLDPETPTVPPSKPKYYTPKRRNSLDLTQDQDLPRIQELTALYTQFADCLEFRHRFQDLSIQNESRNPKNLPGAHIYPKAPEPEYHPETKQFRKHDPKSSVPEKIGETFKLEECTIPGKAQESFVVDDDGVMQVFGPDGAQITDVPSPGEYYSAFKKISTISSDGPCKSFAYQRLEYLEANFTLYYLLNQYEEVSRSKKIPHRDFYNVRKVDTHVHHSACMTQKHLLRFIKSKMKRCSDQTVIRRDGKLLTLNEVFESLGITAYDLNLDTLDVHAHQDAFQRFDKFNLKYNPVGESRLREIFLKTDNYLKGKYLAELSREVFSDLEQSKYQMAEYRISIYGRSPDEWSKLAAWVIDHKLFSHNVRWLIQIPRLYGVYRESNLVSSFGDIIANIWEPLFRVTQDPSCDPKLHVFLQRVIGFDSVDDESKADSSLYNEFVPPSEWTCENNPPYSYYIYYLYSNMTALNQWRKARGFNTFVLRPHSGEAGDPEHLICAFLTSQAISHGILLRKLPVVQFLFYLDQIGIAMSPLSNNALFLSYEKNPFLKYFKRGLNISLSTDDPLQFSFTREPLIEEYSIAIQIYKLNSVDSREIALRSVMQCGFEHELKRHWGYDMHTHTVNVEKTNVPEPRLAYRRETLEHERALVERYGRPGLFPQ